MMLQHYRDQTPSARTRPIILRSRSCCLRQGKGKESLSAQRSRCRSAMLTQPPSIQPGASGRSSCTCGRSYFTGRVIPCAPTAQRSCRPRGMQVFAKGQGKKRAQQQMQMSGGAAMAPPVPDVDKDNVEFVIFMKAARHTNLQIPGWNPVTVVKGGPAANALCRGLDSEWGRKLVGKTLIRNIAQSIYSNRRQLERSVRKAPGMKNVSEFFYAFKIRDKRNPKDWYLAEDLTVLPAEKDIGVSFLESVRIKLTGK